MWEDEYDDPNMEPYTVLHIRRTGERVRFQWLPRGRSNYKLDPYEGAPPGLFYFHVFYRDYGRRKWMSVEGRDEVEAFMVATKLLTKNKAKADKRRAKRNSTS